MDTKTVFLLQVDQDAAKAIQNHLFDAVSEDTDVVFLRLDRGHLIDR
jgi:hypothetical protein